MSNMPKLDYVALRSRAEAYRASVWHRAQALTVAAGLDCYGTIHNAMIDYNRGRPWRGVDYSKARAARRLFERQFAAQDALSRLYARRGYAAFTWGSDD